MLFSLRDNDWTVPVMFRRGRIVTSEAELDFSENLLILQRVDGQLLAK